MKDPRTALRHDREQLLELVDEHQQLCPLRPALQRRLDEPRQRLRLGLQTLSHCPRRHGFVRQEWCELGGQGHERVVAQLARREAQGSPLFTFARSRQHHVGQEPILAALDRIGAQAGQKTRRHQ